MNRTALSSETLRVMGVMTGTSGDGIDLVSATLTATATGLAVRDLHHHHAPLPKTVRELATTVAGGPLDGAAYAQLEYGLSNAIANAAAPLVAEQHVALLGVHGQTVWHRPPPDDAPMTHQILDPWRVAHACGVPVVWDFRRADLVAGGQGAPLAPVAHHFLFGPHLPDGGAVLNAGGIANVTLLPASDTEEEIRAWDTGPAMMVADHLAHQRLQATYDNHGNVALGGAADEQLIAELLSDSWFGKSPPKSTGRERFGGAYLEQVQAQTAQRSDADALRTAVGLSAAAVADALAKAAVPTLIVCGGGARNQAFLAELDRRLPDSEIVTSAAYGIAPEAVEGLAFAVLAFLRVHSLPGNIPSVTGAAHPMLLGAIADPPTGSSDH